MLQAIITPLLVFLSLQCFAAPGVIQGDYVQPLPDGQILKPGIQQYIIDNIGVYMPAAEAFTSDLASKQNNWAIFPIPVTNNALTLKYKGLEKNRGVINVIIYSASGRMASRLRFASSTTAMQIPVDNLCRGTYTMQIIIEKELAWQQFFVK